MLNIQYLEATRIRKGLTIVEYAALAGISKGTYMSLKKTKTAAPKTVKQMIENLKLDAEIFVPDGSTAV